MQGACDAYAHAMGQYFDSEEAGGQHHTMAAKELKTHCADGNEAACGAFEHLKRTYFAHNHADL